MKLKIIDKDKKGFARYCPTFARAYKAMDEGMYQLKMKVDDGVFELQRRRRMKKWAKRLIKGNQDSRKRAVHDICEDARMGSNISMAISALAKALGDEDAYVRSKAAWALSECVRYGADIAEAIPELLRATMDKDVYTRRNVSEALVFSSRKKDEIMLAMPILVNWLEDEEVKKHSTVAKILRRAAEIDLETRVEVLKAIMDFTNSGNFLAKAEENCDYFIEIISILDLLMRRIGEQERKAV
jgi:hypothetical protein